MRREALHLHDIVDAADAVARFIASADAARLRTDDLLLSAVLQKFTVVGEAVNRLPEPFRDAHLEADWSGAVRLRNFITHRYDRIDPGRVWAIATAELPTLRTTVAAILRNEFGEER